ncbi:MAG TPA: PAS domain-containing protein, partial [Candidatus Binatia bacterium]|nr:PAS domain-containing protein [Candidatus Binatia bacterium]
MPKKQQKGKSLSSFYFRFLQPGDAIIGFLESAVDSSMILQRVHPKDRDRARQEHLNAMHERKDYDQEFRIVRSDGAVRHVHIVGHPVFSASGELIEYVS